MKIFNRLLISMSIGFIFLYLLSHFTDLTTEKDLIFYGFISIYGLFAALSMVLDKHYEVEDND